MNKLTTEELQEKYIGARIKYKKSGARKDWLGIITDISKSRVNIIYDNGIDQDYRLDALISSSTSWDNAYLVVVDSNVNSTDSNKRKPPIKNLPYLAVDSANHVSESFDDEDSAIAFALEQVVSAKGFVKVQIYKAAFAVQTKTPEHEIIKLNADGTTI